MARGFDAVKDYPINVRGLVWKIDSTVDFGFDEGCSKRISDYRGVPGIFVEIFVARTSSLVDFKIDSLSHGRCNQRMFGYCVIQMKYSFDRFGRKYSQRISD